MNFQETIQLKALELKQLYRGGGSDSLQEHFLEQAIKTPEGQAMTRNICAHIAAPLFDRVEALCSELSISKRRFVEMALNEAVARAETIVAEVDPFPGEEG